MAFNDNIVEELGMSISTPVLGCDSQSVVYLDMNDMFHSRTKHIDVRHHFIRQVLEDGLVTLTKIKTQDNPADILTKKSCQGSTWALHIVSGSYLNVHIGPLSGRLLGVKARSSQIR